MHVSILKFWSLKMINIKKHSVAVLFVATVVSSAASFGSSVLSSKLLITKEAFGDWKYLQNFIMFISYFINFGLYASGGRLIAATTDKKKNGHIQGLSHLLLYCRACCNNAKHCNSRIALSKITQQ